MEHWALYTADTGDELTRGVQLPEHKARQMAQRTADRIGRDVQLCEEGSEHPGEVFSYRGDEGEDQ